MKQIKFALLFLATALLSAKCFSQSVLTVTDSTLNGWERQPNPNPNTTLQFTTGIPAPLLGKGSLEYYSPDISFVKLRNTSYHNTLLSSITAFRYSTFVQSRDGNTDNIYVVLQIDKNDDGKPEDHLIFEPAWQAGQYAAGIAPDQGPIVHNTWQTWDMLQGVWFNGPPPIPIRQWVALYSV